LRSCHVQGIIIKGRASEPVILVVDGEGASILPARNLWGLETRQCEDRLKKEWNESRLRVACIGPAGENLSAISCIMVGSHSAAGRTGLGAVMGSKKLKAVAVKGAPMKTAPGKKGAEAKARYLGQIRRSEMFPALSTHGQSGYIGWCNEMGMLSTRNYQSGVFEQADRICGSKLNGRVQRHRACFGCPIHCKADARVATGAYAGEAGPRPEFETIAALGAKCGQKDADAVLHLSNLCNRLGLDTISAGSAVAFAMELYEKGVLTRADTQGLALDWGDAYVQQRLLEQIARRQGLGRVLADGVQKASQRIGRGSHRFAFHGKGLELCAYDPRGSMSTALGYAVSGRGGDFAFVYANAEYRWSEDTALTRVGRRRGSDRFSPVAKADIVRLCSVCSAVVDSLGICKIAALAIPAAFDLRAEAELAGAYLDQEIAPADLFVIGERIVNLERLFNLRHWKGSGALDTLPQRFLKETLNHGAARDKRVVLEPMLTRYYELMGWDEKGRPGPEVVRRLGLEGFGA
jgi:aldehyde:ferredoxin oxidoreductase